jgi:tRNA nucleotidyltransferase (CCA-adding enzyme)
MPDYIYLLENRLSADQRNALRHLREVAREAGMILFLTGDAVRDLTSGHAIRDLEVAVHGNALKLKKPVEKLGGTVWGESESSKTLYLCFPGTVRVDVVSTHRVDYTKIDKPVYHAASIQEDLRRRDFTVNAMAISLNEGSFGLLMDPLNGAADIEARTLRLVSNYGFLEEPSLLIRATRYIARLSWELDPKTQTRYENAKGEGVIERITPEALSRELEQIGHEDDGLKVLRALETEGWMKVLFPAWTSAKADEEKLKALHDLAAELQMQGVHPDMSAAQMQLLTAKMGAKELSALKKQLLRPGFVEEWNSLDAIAAKFAKVLLSKEKSTPSAGFKLFTSYDPEAVLWLGFTSKDKTVQERYNQFLKVWPEARQKTPHALMQEMRITPELATYKEIVHAIFLELIDGKLTTPEEMRAFLEPHSPPAPPPQITIKRPRAKRGEAKVKERTFDDDEDSDDALDDDDDLDDIGGDDEVDLGISIPKGDLDIEPESEDAESEHADDDLDSDSDEPTSGKRGSKGSAAPKGGKGSQAAVKTPAAGSKAKVVPAPASAKPTAPSETKAAKSAVSRKEGKMADSTPAAVPGVKPPQAKGTPPTQSLAPGVKPPQALQASVLGAPNVKTAQVSKPKAPAAKAVPAKSPPVAKAKKPVAKAAPVKAKAIVKKVTKAPPVKAKTAKAKPAPKPVAKSAKKKAAPVKKAKPAVKKGKKR